MEVALGIQRIGPGVANVYLFEESGAVTIVDAGMPGHWNPLPAELAAMGRSLEGVRAVVLTHAHTDHIGFAERRPALPPSYGMVGTAYTSLHAIARIWIATAVTHSTFDSERASGDPYGRCTTSVLNRGRTVSSSLTLR